MSTIAIDLTGPDARVIRASQFWPRVRRVLHPTEAKCVYGVTAALYLTIGAVLVFGFHSVLGDALSRAANGSYVLYGRDPHVASIGFDWMPLPSVAALPFLALRPWWSSVASTGFASNIASALCMAGAVMLMRGIFEDFGVRARTRLVLTALFALHPMILYYGSNGMSEAAMLCALLGGTRPLLRWLHDDNPVHLAPAGFGFGIAYLTRYEGLVAGVSAVGLVAIVSIVRSRGHWRVRRTRALADIAVIGLPVAGAFALWSFTRWLIMGQAFISYGQVYGTQSDVAHLHTDFARLVGGHSAGAYEAYRLTQTAMLAPALPLALLVAVIFATHRRDARVLGSIASLASILVFQDFFFVTGGSYGWLRFSITAVPLVFLLAALPLAGRAALARPSRVWPLIRQSLATGSLTVLAFALVLPAIPTAAVAMTNMRLAREEAPQLRAIGAVLAGKPRNATLHRWDDDRAVARTVDRMHLRRGSVLLDATDGFAVILAARDPSTYVITPDRDFKATLADPALWDVRYILVAPTANHVIERTYPHMYQTGGGIGTLVQEFPARYGGYTWRLYRVDKLRVTVG
jgi:hypothetical protein